jgi:hypothetical protein
MFDLYLYDADNGNFVGLDPMRTAKTYKAAAMDWHGQGYAVKVVDLEDGCVVYTLGV